MKENLLWACAGAFVVSMGMVLTVGTTTYAPDGIEWEEVVTIPDNVMAAGIAEVIYEIDDTAELEYITSTINRINEETIIEDEPTPLAEKPHLNKVDGVFDGPSGKETYYNLDMKQVVKYMRDLGYDETHFPYHVREDGVKMLGQYIMIAADLSKRPKGTILPTSLGQGIVCDTGDFVKENPTQIDIAVTW